MSDLSQERDESSSSVSQSPRLRSSPLSGGLPCAINTGSRGLGLADGCRGNPLHLSADNTRLRPDTITQNGRSPNILAFPTSPTSGRSVSFDIPRSLSHREDKRSKRSSFEAVSPVTNPPRVLTNVSEQHPSPSQMTNTALPNPSEDGWPSATNPFSHTPGVEGLPNLGEATDPNAFKCTQPATADEIPSSSSDRPPTPPSRSHTPHKPPNYHEATNSPVLTPANIGPAILPPKRVALLRLSSLPPPAFTMNNEDGCVRFSPALIGRHVSTAIRPLPPTSIARRSSSPAPSLRSNTSHGRLRNVPALAMDGTDGGDGDGSGDDEDDHDDDHVPITSSPGSEDEDDDVTTEREEGSSTYASASGSPQDPRPDPNTSSRVTDGEKTPHPQPHPQDYFSVHPTRSDSMSWMTPGSTSKRVSLTPKERPSTLYHQASKSMVNLLSNPRRDLSSIDEEKGKGKATDSIPSVAATDINVLPEGSRLQRRRSLPTFTEATEPPPYPFLDIPTRFIPKIFPRDEEGKEPLPTYSNDILLFGILPRKLEFSAPGVQARDRKWRRAFCVLEGTAFRVFEPPASSAGIGVVGRWWERKVGVGDLTSDAPLPKKTKTTTLGSQKIDQDFDENEDQFAAGPPPSIVASERGTATPPKKSKLHPSGFPHLGGTTSGTSSRRQSGETFREDVRNGHSMSTPRPRVSSITTTNTTGRPSISSYRRPASPMSTKSAQSECIPLPQNRQPLRVYTLQHAESGLASDYLKRKNVIRVRMEGEQFLLQVPSVQAVVDWIEVGF